MAKGIGNTYDLKGRAIREAAENYTENHPGSFPHAASAFNHIMRCKNYQEERDKFCCYNHGCSSNLVIRLQKEPISICMNREETETCSKRKTEPIIKSLAKSLKSLL